jgi:uncharacterized protein YbjT (DUF2867 family)
MTNHTDKPILVFGATGQQGGSVAVALLNAGWPVRAVVRDMLSPQAVALRESGADLVHSTFADTDVLRTAMAGAHGVFSVQPSSGQGPVRGMSNADEERFGKGLADLAVETGVEHFVYTSVVGAGDGPSGMEQFETKARIEAYIRDLPLKTTIIRPATFMEMLVMPGSDLSTGRLEFFVEPDGSMQFLAAEDIGCFVAAIFADPARFIGQAFEIASETVTGNMLGAYFTEAAGRLITYGRFPDEALADSPFLENLTALVRHGTLAGHADLEALRVIHPAMHSFRSWLAGSGRTAFEQALGGGVDR